MDKIVKYLLIGMALLIILTPIGLIASGTAYGEWGADELQEKLGYIPAGLNGLSELWHAPLSDYGLPGQGDSLADMTPGYLISAIIGVAVCGGLLYFGGKLLIKNKDDKE